MATLTEMLNLAIRYHHAGRLREAEQIYHQIVQADSSHVGAWYLLGILSLQQGRLAEAVAHYQQVLRLKPDHVEAHANLGNVLCALGRFDEAVKHFEQALKLGSGSAAIHTNLGNALHDLGRDTEALKHYEEALRLDGNSADTHYNLAITLRQLGRLDEAVQHYQEAIRLKPDFINALYNLGNGLADLGQHDRTVEYYERAIRLKPDHFEAHVRLGNALRSLGRLDEALLSYERALQFQPRSVEICYNIGDVRYTQGRLDEAIARYEQTLSLQPNHLQAHNNVGNALRDLGRIEEALDHYDRALQLNPDFCQAHYNRALAWLLRGNFERGWPEFEWRWRCEEFAKFKRFAQPEWDGSPLAGRTILLHNEAGLGDAIQFIRYAPLVKQRGGKVIVECQSTLVSLLQSCPGIDEVIASGTRLPSFDVRASLMSLPSIFGTAVATIPAEVPYLFADSGLVERWRIRLDKETRRQGDRETRQGDKETRRQGDKETRRQEGVMNDSVSLSPCLPVSLSALRVGIAWQGNPIYLGDRQRSVRLAQFAPLAKVEGVRLFSLQKGLGTEQLVEVGDQFVVTNLESDLESFMNTAAVMMNLDLVITVDTSVAHCAGALGVPVWVLVPFAGCWRWLLDREDSPWYPTVRLFRQNQRGEWDEVFGRVVEAIKVISTRPYSDERALA